MKTQLFIPKEIKVGFNKREDTYTKKLAYIVYYDNNGVLRKEKSWESWRDKSIKAEDYKNEPTEGFVLNKNVGGVRQSYGWNARNEYARVFDPRGFEFEISFANLLFILQESNSIKGKGLEGKFIYCWEGKELVLLPVNCEEYKKCQEYTDLQSQGIGIKDLVPGCIYKTKKQEELIYMGRFPWYKVSGGLYSDKSTVTSKKMFVFSSVNKYSNDIKFHPYPGLTTIASKVTNEPVSHYADLMDKLNKMKNMSYPVSVIEKYSENVSTTEFLSLNNGIYEAYSIYNEYNTDPNAEQKYIIEKKYQMRFDFGKQYSCNYAHVNNKPRYSYYNRSETKSVTLDELEAKNFVQLFIVLENGTKINFHDYY